MRINKTKISLSMAERDMLQKDLAELAGMSRGNISTLINGKNCQARTIFKIAKAINIDATEIMETEN